MGWELTFSLDAPNWPEDKTVPTKIAEAMCTSDVLSFYKLTICQHDLVVAHAGKLNKGIVAEVNEVEAILESEFRDLMEANTQPGILYDLHFTSKRIEFGSEVRDYGMHLYVFDKEFTSWPAGLSTGMTYDAGSSKLYSKLYRESRGGFEYNLSRLLKELQIFINVGITTIRGFGNERDDDMRTHHLCYHLDLTRYVADLRQIAPPLFEIETVSQADLSEIVSRCQKITGRSIGDGFMIWSVRGTDDTLGEFYEMFLAWCEEKN